VATINPKINIEVQEEEAT